MDDSDAQCGGQQASQRSHRGGGAARSGSADRGIVAPTSTASEIRLVLPPGMHSGLHLSKLSTVDHEATSPVCRLIA
jgi:hypothetical protein